MAPVIVVKRFWKTLGIGAIRTVPVPSNVLSRPSPEDSEPRIERVAFWTSNLRPEVCARAKLALDGELFALQLDPLDLTQQ